MRYVSNLPKLVEGVGNLVEFCRARGMEVEICRDFEEFGAVYRDLRPDERLCPIFDPEKGGIGSDNGFWVKGTTGDGRIVHMQAVRCDRFLRGQFAEHLRRDLMLYAPHDMEPIPQRCFVDTRPIRDLEGKIAYHGETWLAGGEGGMRGRGLGPACIRLGLLLLALNWDPDVYWGIVDDEKAQCGLGLKYGFARAVPNVFEWAGRDSEVRLKEWLLLSDRGEVQELSQESRYSRHEGNLDIRLKVA